MRPFIVNNIFGRNHKKFFFCCLLKMRRNHVCDNGIKDDEYDDNHDLDYGYS